MYRLSYNTEGEIIAKYAPGIDYSEYIEPYIEVTEEQWKSTLDHSKHINPETRLLEDKPPYIPSRDELLKEIRVKRNRLLAESDFTQLPDAPFSNEKKEEYRIYRQELRDFPETCDPENHIWPVKPQ